MIALGRARTENVWYRLPPRTNSTINLWVNAVVSYFVKRTTSAGQTSNSLTSFMGMVICIFVLKVVFKLKSSRTLGSVLTPCMEL